MPNCLNMPSIPKVRLHRAQWVPTARRFFCLCQDPKLSPQGHGSGYLAIPTALKQLVKVLQGGVSPSDVNPPAVREPAPQRLAPLFHIHHFRAVFRWPVIGHLFQIVIRNRDSETITEMFESFQIKFLDGVGIIGRFHPRPSRNLSPFSPESRWVGLCGPTPQHRRHKPCRDRVRPVQIHNVPVAEIFNQ